MATIGKISPGNRKLGKSPAIASWNIPAGPTCPGATAWCAKYCYAKKIERIYTNSRIAYARNYGATIPALDARVQYVRIHANGDFYNVNYIQEWTDYARANPGVLFWAYTRSWRVPDLLPSLETVRALPNMQLFASVDPSTPENPPIGWRVAYVDGTPDQSGYPCPEQSDRKESCLACGYCFKGKKHNVVFGEH
ncbi:hypothetical protein CMI37_33335 [Candidatus Pacearchaeota archaeon]|nr:hypothetical protein [Candidatus Pacearchaeota archaeon]